MNMNLIMTRYTKHFDMALHLQSPRKKDIRAHARAARPVRVAVCYTNPFWTPAVAEEPRGSDVRVGITIPSPYGCTSTDMKLAETEEGLRLEATAVDMVVNIGRLREGGDEFTRREAEGLVEWTRGTALLKVIFEICFLIDEEAARLTRICSDAGVDHVEVATGLRGPPTEIQVQVMRDNITNDNTKLKVSGAPRTFTMPTTLWMIKQLDVSLIGTWLAASFV